MTVLKRASARDPWFASLLALITAGFWKDFTELVRFSLNSDLFSYILLIPVVTFALVALDRDTIFRNIAWGWMPGTTLMAAGIALLIFERRAQFTHGVTSLAATTFCAWVLIAGAVALCYGARVVRAAVFPLLFLVLIVPLPGPIINSSTVLLQRASYDLTYGLFRAAGVPVLPHGFMLLLQDGKIYIGPECSSIHSTFGLLLGSLIAVHLFLRSLGKKLLLIAIVIPVSIFKNALRIVVLYYLGFHTDQQFLTGELHHIGGIPFSVLALAILGPLLWVLRRSELGVIGPKVKDQAPRTVRALESPQQA